MSSILFSGRIEHSHLLAIDILCARFWGNDGEVLGWSHGRSHRLKIGDRERRTTRDVRGQRVNHSYDSSDRVSLRM